MDNIFVYKNIRGGVAKKRQLVIEGYCNKNILKRNKLKIFLNGQDVQELSCKTYLREIGSDEAFDFVQEGINSILDVAINMPETVDNEAELYVMLLEDGSKDNWTSLYCCNGRLINNTLKLLNCYIDSIEAIENKITIKGVVYCKENVDVQISGKEDFEDTLECSVEWVKEAPNRMIIQEEKKNIAKGFEITFPKNSFAVWVRISTDDRCFVKRIRPSVKIYASAIVTKTSRFVRRAKYSVKNFGVKETSKKAVKRLTNRPAGKKNISYEKWLEKREISSVNRMKMNSRVNGFTSVFGVIVSSIDKKEYKNLFADSLKEQIYNRYYVVNNSDDFSKEYSTGDNSEYFIFGRESDVLSEDALYRCAQYIEDEQPDFIYSDNDLVDVDLFERSKPNLKPDFNLDLIRSCNYIGRILGISKAFGERLVESDLFPEIRELSDIRFLDVADYNFILRCIELAKSVKHIPYMIYSEGISKRVDIIDRSRLYMVEQSDYMCTSVRKHLERLGVDAIVEPGEIDGVNDITYRINQEATVSIIIPNKDHWQDLKRCIESVEKRSIYRNYEIVVVENNSEEPETFNYYSELDEKPNIRIVYWKGEFNYSAINNFGARAASGDYLLLLNNDTSIISKDAIYKLLGCCQRPEVGIAGSKLMYEDGTIQHAGIVIGMGGIAGNAFAGVDEASGSYLNRTYTSCDYNAVTAACLMISKDLFFEVGGFDEELGVAFNDVDLCLKVRTLGKLVVYNANVKLNHYESKSRGQENTPEKLERFYDEIEQFRDRWQEILDGGDSYFNRGLDLYKSDFSLASEEI